MITLHSPLTQLTEELKLCFSTGVEVVAPQPDVVLFRYENAPAKHFRLELLRDDTNLPRLLRIEDLSRDESYGLGVVSVEDLKRTIHHLVQEWLWRVESQGAKVRRGDRHDD